MMTRRELINALLDGDMNDEMWIAVSDGEEWEESYPVADVDNDVLLIKGFIYRG